MSQERLSLRKIREIIRLKYEAGLSNRAIAGACKISNSTVGQYLRRANLPELAGRAGHVSDAAAGEELLGGRVPDVVLEALRPADWTEQALEWAKVRLFQVNPVLSENYIRVMHGSRLSEKLAALRTGLFPSRGVMAILYGVPPDSWRITSLYPCQVVTRIEKYWGRAWDLARGDQLQTVESESDQALRDWLKIA